MREKKKESLICQDQNDAAQLAMSFTLCLLNNGRGRAWASSGIFGGLINCVFILVRSHARKYQEYMFCRTENH
ncbi:hypothetical protein llap_20242 [Limosa lapponica baueri]|uniref:Uncharacterized protein n=1 Tax=Limosa lapponica baueri TaxID=1758121 RepID=A0A2I0T6M6_LIMLA|nr:hypothetical protein llap_20242 [Limosa lapponica baueri]